VVIDPPARLAGQLRDLARIDERRRLDRAQPRREAVGEAIGERVEQPLVVDEL
jgi:hypothetical protein